MVCPVMWTPLHDLANPAASFDGTVGGAVRIVLHSAVIKKNIIADEEDLLKDEEGKARGMAIDMKCLHAMIDEVFRKSSVKSEGATDPVNRIFPVDAHFGGKMLPVEI
jgi:hypothetical protein